MARYIQDRLYELLVDITDEGSRSLGALRFYARRSFAPTTATRSQALARLQEWIDLVRVEGWAHPTEASWQAVDAWFELVLGDPDRSALPEGPSLTTTPRWRERMAAREVLPEGTTAWTWPPGSDAPW